MNEKRVSNEVLGKVVVQVVKDLEKSLKTHEKTQVEHQEVIKHITNKAVVQLNEELKRLERFSIDLKPLDETMTNYINIIEKASEKAKKEVNTPMLGIKAISIFAFVLISVLSFTFFTSNQAKELKKERESKEHFIKYLNSDTKRYEDYRSWIDK